MSALGDGGIGTQLLSELSPKIPCVDLLNALAPEQVKALHQAYALAGATLLTSNTFCCDPDSLAQTAWAKRYDELAQLGAQCVREAVPKALVAGSLGPGWRSPARGEISVQALIAIYRRRAAALLKGGTDLFWIETVQDPLQAEAAVIGCCEALKESHLQRPIAVLVSPSADGRQVGSHPISQVLSELVHLPIQLLGVNCAWGPISCLPSLDWLCENSPHQLGVFPNAGLPQMPIAKADWLRQMQEIQQHYQPDWVGGCCGVGPTEIALLKQWLDA